MEGRREVGRVIQGVKDGGEERGRESDTGREGWGRREVGRVIQGVKDGGEERGRESDTGSEGWRGGER